MVQTAAVISRTARQ